MPMKDMAGASAPPGLSEFLADLGTEDVRPLTDRGGSMRRGKGWVGILMGQMLLNAYAVQECRRLLQSGDTLASDVRPILNIQQCGCAVSVCGPQASRWIGFSFAPRLCAHFCHLLLTGVSCRIVFASVLSLELMHFFKCFFEVFL